MSATLSLLPTSDGDHASTILRRRTQAGTLDRLHDHVLRLVGDADVAGRVVTDVATRAAARATELGEPATFARLVGLAHARLAIVDPVQPDSDVVARLAGEDEPAGRALVRAVAAADPVGAAVLDLTTRHGLDVGRAAGLLDIDRARATSARERALGQVRTQLAEADVLIDVEGTLARLPIVAAPAQVHNRVDLPDPTGTGPRVPTHLAWFGTAATIVLTAAGLTLGLPKLVAADARAGAPVAVAEAVEDGPAAARLAEPVDADASDEVEELVVREQAPATAEPAEAPAASPEPVAEESSEPAAEPSEEAAPAAPEDEPDEQAEPSPEPSPEPSEDPLQIELPTGP